MKGSIFRETIVGRRIGGDSLRAKDKYVYLGENALAMHSLIPSTAAEGCNIKAQGSERSASSTSTESTVDCSSKTGGFSVISPTKDD